MKVVLWALLVAAICVIIWLVFKPVPTADNSAAYHAIDSLTSENKALRKALNATEGTYIPKVDSLTKIVKTLKDVGSIQSGKITTLLTTNSEISQAYEILKASGKPIDSICDVAMKRIPIDSAIIVYYQENTNKLINSLGQISSAKDSIILAQHRVITSDSVLIQNQASLNKTQEKQLKKAQSESKLVAWLARGLAVTTGVLFILFETK